MKKKNVFFVYTAEIFFQNEDFKVKSISCKYFFQMVFFGEKMNVHKGKLRFWNTFFNFHYEKYNVCKF